MYDDLASWWPLLSPPSDYEEEAAFYVRTLRKACGPLETILELGSGGGNNASHMKAGLRMVLVEPSAGMREVSQALNPDCEHVAGDMRTVRLGRQFDAVFVHDAVGYMATATDLRLAIETAYLHTRPGGAALFAPDCLRDNFKSNTDHGGSDRGARGVRFLEWTWDPDPRDTQYRVEYILALRTEDGTVRVEHDRHVEGLFSRAEWLEFLSEVGFVPEAVRFDHSELEPGSYEVLVARRP